MWAPLSCLKTYFSSLATLPPGIRSRLSSRPVRSIRRALRQWDQVPQVPDLEAEPAADVVGPDPLPDRLPVRAPHALRQVQCGMERIGGGADVEGIDRDRPFAKL